MMKHVDSDYEPHLHSAPEAMETLILDEPSNGESTSGLAQPSQSTTFSDDYHPLLKSPSSFGNRPNPNSPFNSFVDPPSYADAVFTSFDPSSDCHESLDLSPKSLPFGSDYLSISVLDPQKEQEPTNSIVSGGTTYYTYLITTRTNLPEYGGPGSEYRVRRRFRDVVALADRLAESYRGFIIPIRPDKSSVESQVMQKKEFVEQRRVALQKYFNKLAAHPVIRNSDGLKVFLEVKGNLPSSQSLDEAEKLPRQLFASEAGGAVDVTEVAQPAKGWRDLFWIFKELKQSVSNDWGGTKPLVVEEDKEFLERKDKIMEFEQLISDVSLQAESLVKCQQDTGETMGELGLAFVKLTKFETEEALFESQRIRAADMRNVATAAVKASRLYRELNVQTVKHLDMLHEYLGITLSINNAFCDRSGALLTVQTLSSELVSLQTKIEKLEVASSKIFGGDKSKIQRMEELKETRRVTEDAKRCADNEYEWIKENNRKELDRMDRERQDDLMSMLKGFVVNQAGFAEKMEQVWQKLAEDTIQYSPDQRIPK